MPLPPGFEVIESPIAKQEKAKNLPEGFELIENPFKLPERPPAPEPYSVGSGILDLLKQTVSPAVAAPFQIPRGAELAVKGAARKAMEGEPEAVMPSSVYSPGLDTEETIFGPETEAQKARRKLGAQRAVASMPSIPYAKDLAKIGDKVQKDIYESLSPQGKQALKDTEITGNLFKGEVDFGTNPNAMGYALQVANVFGSLAPVLITAGITKSPGAAGAVGGGMAADEAGQNAAQEINKLSDAQLREQSPFYAQMIAGGASPKEARQLTISKAAESGAILQGLVATFGDRFTGQLVTGAFDNVLKKMAGTTLGRRAAGLGIGMGEEGLQETAEGVASNIGIQGVLPKTELGEGSAANFILGALGGAGPGAISGIHINETPEEQRARVLSTLLNESVKGKTADQRAIDQQAINAMRPDRGFQAGTNIQIDPQTGQPVLYREPPAPTEPTGIAALTPAAPAEGIAGIQPPVVQPTPVVQEDQEAQDKKAMMDEVMAALGQPVTSTSTPVKVEEPNIVNAYDMGNNMEYRVIKTQNGYTANMYDKDSGQYVSGSARIFRTDKFGDEALTKANEFAQSEQAKTVQPQGVSSGTEVSQIQQTKPQEQQAPVGQEQSSKEEMLQRLKTSAPETAETIALRPRVNTVIQQLKDAGLDNFANIVEGDAVKNKFDEKKVKHWEEWAARMIAQQNLIKGAEKGINKPVEPRNRTLADLYESKYENQSGLYIPKEITDLVLNKANEYIKQAADLGVNLEDIDSRFPQSIVAIKDNESRLRGQFLRYANQRKMVERDYKKANLDGFLKAEKELGDMLGVDLAPLRGPFESETTTVTPTTPAGVTPTTAPVTPTVSPTDITPAITPQTAEETVKINKAKDDLTDALGDLAELLTKNTRMNIVPEDEQKLMPILSRLMDAAFRMGYYKFKQAARFIMKTIREKLGKNVADQITLDHLQGSYISMAGKYQEQGASSKKEVVSVESLQELEEEAAADLSTPDGKFAVAQKIADLFNGGAAFANIVEARKAIEEMTGQKIEAGTESAKQADEAIEVGVVLASRNIVEQGRKDGLTKEQIYDKLVDLYGRQPNLSVRSSTSVSNQAYSTPNALAFLASERAGINNKTTVYEPTAGNGMLLIGANPNNVNANELNADRYEMLQRIMDGATVTQGNALDSQIENNTFDVVIENPPFGKAGEISNIDHNIALASLQTLKEDGRAVLILGGVQANTEEGRREGYRGSAKRNFYFELYNLYNVVDHFTVGGNLYAKQGTTYPVDVIVIDGWGKSKRDLPAADLPQVFTSYEQLKEKLNDRVVSTGNVSPAGTNVGVSTEGGVKPSTVGERTERQGNEPGTEGRKPAGVGERGVSEAGTTGGAERKPSGERTGEGQPKPADVSERGANKGSVSGEGERGKPTSEGGTERGGPGKLGRVSVVAGERVESGLKQRAGQEQETASQVTYTPKSSAIAVGTLAPKAMAQSIQDSIDRIESQVGNVDEFVAESLEMDPDTLREKFSAEQIDALVLAIRNAQEGKGFIIGDQTGVGKGRVVAAMIKYAMINGKIPIFVTEKPNLYSDMIRDLDDIGMTDELGLDTAKTNIFITNGGESIPYTLLRKVNGEITENNLILKAPKSGAALDGMMKEMQEKEDLGNFKVIFTTYSQLQTVKGKPTERQRFIKTFGAGNYMIFDESHNAGGAGETQARTKEQRDQQKEGKGLAQGRAAFVRNLVQDAYGTFFSSATYAKRPDVMDLYSSTDMKFAVEKLADLADAIKNGGIPMQQTVATMLSKAGQYIRRERTFAGVSYDTKETKVDKDTAENMASSMRQILAFSRAKEEVVKGIQKELDRQGAKVGGEGEKTQVQSANFGSIMHNLIDQMLLSLKAQDSVQHAIDRLKAGEKVVMTVSNTMGSFLQNYADEMGLVTGDAVDLSFADLYQRYLEKQRIIKIKKPRGASEEYRLTDQDLGPALTARFNEIRDFIESSGFGSAPISPIDYLHSELNKAGYKTEEITGRTITLNYSSGKPLLTSRSANIKQRVTAVKNFNNGKADVIILNQAGSTGLSLHASEKVDDKRKRHMIIVQPEKNIDTHMQMLGRVHRTGQVVTPAYSQMMADIPAEMRPAAVLLKKMASLNANTTGSRKSAVAAEGAVDFMNDYGGQVAQEYLRDNPDVYEDIGGKRIVELVDNPTEATENDIRRLTGYIPILPIKQQEEVYKDLIERYTDLVAREESMGTNKLESKAKDLDAKTISSVPITEDKNVQSDFGKPAFMEQVDVKRTVKPFSKDEVKEQIEENLGGKTSSEFSKDLLKDLNDRVRTYVDERVQDVIEEDNVKADTINSQVSGQASHVRSVIESFPIGSQVSIKNTNGVFVYGVITNITNSKKTKNPVAGSDWKMQIALANGDSKTTSLSFSQVGSSYTLKREQEINWLNPDTLKGEYIPLMDLFDKGAIARREKRWMVTGNILAGYAAVNNMGQIMSYTKDDGTTGQGVLMPRTFDFEKAQKEAPVKLKSANNVMQFFDAFDNGTVKTEDGNLRIVKRNNTFVFAAEPSKKLGGTYFLDRGLTDITGDFYKRGAFMDARYINEDTAIKAIQYLLATKGVSLEAANNKEEARKLFAPKPFKPGLANVSYNNAYHSGDLGYGKDTVLGRMSGRSTGHFGTGVYFVGNPQKLKTVIRDERPTEKVSFDGFNLATPRNNDNAQRLHDGLRQVNQLVTADLQTKEADEKIKRAASDIWFAVGAGKFSEEQIQQAIRKALAEAAPLYEEVSYTSKYVESASTRVMKKLGFDGIDVRGLSEFDNTTYGSVIYQKQFTPRDSINSLQNQGPIGQRLNLDENRFMDRADLIRQYQSLRQKRAGVLAKFAKGEAGLNEQRAITAINETAGDLSNQIKASKPERRSAKNFFADATRAWDAGEINDDVYSAIKTLYERHPNVLEGLKFSVRMNPEKDSNAAGQFFSLARIVRLYKGTTGTTDPVTIRHEIVHSLEQMMSGEASADLINDWADKLGKAIKTKKSPEAQVYFRAVLEFFENPTEDSFKNALRLLPSYDYYQYLNPSEYWAVNAEKLMARKLGSGWDRFVLSVKGMYEALKDMFGFDNQYLIHKIFDDVMNGRGERFTKAALNDYVLQESFALMNQNVRRNYKGGPAPLATWQEANESKIDNFIYKWQDKHVDTKRVVEAIKNEVGRIEDAWDPYLQEELFHGRTAKQTTDFLKGELRPFLEKMDKDGIKLQDFEEYLHNRHAEVRNNFIAARNPGMPDGGSGIYTQEARDYMAGLDPKTRAKYEDLATTLDRFVKETQDLLVSSGLEKQETIDAWRKLLPFYVPLNRDADELDYVNPVSGMGQGFGVRGAFSKTATGSLKTVVDIVGNIALQRERAIVRAEKARVGRALYALAIQNPNPNFWMPINPDAIKNKKKLYAEMVSMGMNPADADNIVQEPRVARIDPTTGLVRYSVNPVLRNSPNVLPIRINGEDRFVYFNAGNPNAKRMVESLKNLDVQQMDEALSSIAEITRFIAAASTQFNPVFGAFNFVRDVQGAAINLSSTPIADRKLQVINDSKTAVRAIYRDLRGKGATTPAMQQWIDLFEQYQKAGGQTGFREQFSKSKEKATIVQRELSRLNQGNLKKATYAVLDLLSDYNDAMENAVRLAAFKAALDEGISVDRAASIAKNITVNFNRKGANTSSAAALYAFLNASIQGTARLIGTLFVKDANGKMSLSPAGKKIVAGGMLLGVAQTALLAMAGFGPDDPPEWVKSKNLVIPTGDGKYITIPMPLGFNVFPNVGRIVSEYMMVQSGGMKGRRDLKKTITYIGSTILDAFNPLGSSTFAQTLAPTIVDPFVAIAENKDAFGRPISKEDKALAPTPGYKRSRESANGLSQALAYGLNYITGGGDKGIGLVSPTADQISYVAGQYSGGVGRLGIQTAEYVKSKVVGEEVQPYQVPIVGKMYGDINTPAAISGKFYDNITEMSKHENIIKGMKGKGVTEYYQENPEARLWQRSNYVENQIARLKKEKKALSERNAPEAQLKRKDEQIKQLMESFNKEVTKRQ